MSLPEEINVTTGAGGFQVTPFQTADQNTTNLQGLLNLLISGAAPYGKGGTLVFPVGDDTGTVTYNFDGPVYVGAPDGNNDGTGWSIIIRGSGQGRLAGAPSTPYPLLKQNANAQGAWSDLFVVNTNDGKSSDIGGVVFQDLAIRFADGAPTGNAAIRIIKGSQNCRVFRVSLVECPIGVAANNSLQASIIDSTFFNANISGIGVQLGEPGSNPQAVETFITGTTFLSYSGGGTALQIYGCEHLRMSHCRLEGWKYGIDIDVESGTGNIWQAFFSNVTVISSNAGLQISCNGGTGTAANYVTQLTFIQCDFEPNNAATTYTGGGIVVNSPGNADSYIDQVRFIDCFSCFWYGPGLLVSGGTNVEVLGGHYSCNGNMQGGSPAEPYSPSGIAIVGAVENFRVSNVACNNLVFNIYTGAYADLTQQYGLYVGGAAAGVRLNGCVLNGNTKYGLWIDGTAGTPGGVSVKACTTKQNTTGPVQVTGTVNDLQISECPGYNDQNTPVASSGFTSTRSAASVGYYGPSVLTWYNTGPVPTTLTLNGITYRSQFGSVYLSLNDAFSLSGPPTTVTWVGK